MSLEYAILGFLSEGEHSGYDLKTRCLDRRVDHFWSADQARVYRVLEGLETRGLATSRRVPQRGRPDRRVYRLTTRGLESLDGWLAQPHDRPFCRDPLLLQLFFAGQTPPAALVAILTHARATRQECLDDLRTRLSVASTPSSPTENGYGEVLRLMTIQGAIASARTDIDWLDDCIDTVEAERRARDNTSGPPRLFEPAAVSSEEGKS